MARHGKILVRTVEATHSVALSTRDVRLLDGRYFFRDGWAYRKLFGLDFVKGLKSPPLEVPLVVHGRVLLLIQLRNLIVEFETQKDLITFDYSYSFDDNRDRRSSAGESGFRIEGGYGSIDARPAGYCDLTISEVGPNGRGRVVTIIDMRVRRRIETTDRGVLQVTARKATVGWFSELENLIAFLDQQSADTVEVLHTVEA
ncbi:MAG: hypothetical protein P4L84_06880 [Isosphaeraceae bacterium]|nr:hypothetical protein [Isosphaeraceae bacterium]